MTKASRQAGTRLIKRDFFVPSRCCGVIVLLIVFLTHVVEADAFKVRELSVVGTQLNDHYEVYNYLTSAADLNYLDKNRFTSAADYESFAQVVPNVNTGTSAGGWPDSPTDPFLLGNDYALDVRASVKIPQGKWQIAFGSDEGGQLTLADGSFQDPFGLNDPLKKGATNQLWYANSRPFGWTGGSFEVGAGGLTTLLHASMHDRDGGDAFEIAIRNNSDGLNDTRPRIGERGWQLLGNGVMNWSVNPSDSLPAMAPNGLPVRPTAPSVSVVKVTGANGSPFGQLSLPSTARIASSPVAGATAKPGLFQRWVNQSNQGTLLGNLSGLRVGNSQAVTFQENSTWWEGNQTNIAEVPSYPASLQGALGSFSSAPGANNDNYIALLTGEINLGSGTTRFRLAADEYKYLAIDTQGNGIAGDQPGEVLFDENVGVGSQGTGIQGEAPSVAAATVNSGGWYAIQMIVAESTGRDNGVLYWDEGHETLFPQGAPFLEGNTYRPADYLVPETALRSVPQDKPLELGLVGRFETGQTLEIDLGARGKQDRVVLQDLFLDTTMDVSGLTVKLNQTEKLSSGDAFTIFDADRVLHTSGFRIEFPAGTTAEDWDVTQLMDNDPKSSTIFYVPRIKNDCNNDGVVNAADLACACASGRLSEILVELGLVRGDLDGDREIGFTDFLRISSKFGEAGTYIDGDIDCDGSIGFADFLVLSTRFGQTSRNLGPSSGSVASVPEPVSTWTWLCLWAGCWIRSRVKRAELN